MNKEKVIECIKDALKESDEWWYEDGGKYSYKKIQSLLEQALKELEDKK